MNSAKRSLLPLSFFFILQLCGTIASTYHDAITPNQLIRDRDGDTLISSGKVFALGFFSPAKSTGRYVGIWFNNLSDKAIVWTANRDTPANDTSGVLSVTPRGNLVLLAQNLTIWSSNVSVPTNHPRIRLLDSGNLVLSGSDTDGVITWQSFDYPTDTYLPHMKLGLDRRTGLNRVMRSWKSEDNPGTGMYSHAIDPTGFPQAFLYKGARPLWRMGSWTGVKWSGVPEMDSSVNISTVTFVDNQDEVYVSHGVTDESLLVKLVLDTSGSLRLSTWNQPGRLWFEYWQGPKESCDYYDKCGANSICEQYDTQEFHCQCLQGHTPKSPPEWGLKNWSGGCVGASICQNEDVFVKVLHVKVPDTKLSRVNMSLNSLEACEQECRRNCSCKAYAYADERRKGCMTWHRDLIDIRTYTSSGQDLYVRSTSGKDEDSNRSRHRRWMLPLFICLGILLALVATIIYCKLSAKTNGEPLTLSFSKLRQSSANAGDLPIPFDLATISAATDNFSFVNKLGQGGFGPVYKGHLLDGKDIAVKRLSKNSGQGADEFKNEVSLIAKLQHRNLVKILGYCIEEETMLVYEYLPNKSLDFFLFDETKRSLLDWTKRFNIIYGVARGIQYLHEDSRLRIVHRDLKSSNVLLDAAMNPKISDFGMARIFGEDETEGNTKRVVGTYGYMAPEYAMEGLFSTKSDVYSFGVLLLEVVTGKRNTGCYYHEEGSTLNLIGHVWEVWTRGMGLEIVDETMEEKYSKDEVMRCIQIGLLCVQEFAADRPSSSAVVFMLGNKDTSYQLPSPNQPAFSCKRSDRNGEPDQHPTSSSLEAGSVNSLTISLVEPR